MDDATLRLAIPRIMQYRARKDIWIGADNRVFYGEVVSLMDELTHGTPDLTIAIATRADIGPVDPAELKALAAQQGMLYPLVNVPPPCLAR